MTFSVKKDFENLHGKRWKDWCVKSCVKKVKGQVVDKGHIQLNPI